LLHYSGASKLPSIRLLDMNAAGAGIYAPRIGPLGPDWQRDRTKK